jgi:hypothetical protein
MKGDPTEIWCDGGMDKGRLLCTIMNLNLPEVMVFLVITAPSFCYFCTTAVRRETLLK